MRYNPFSVSNEITPSRGHLLPKGMFGNSRWLPFWKSLKYKIQRKRYKITHSDFRESGTDVSPFFPFFLGHADDCLQITENNSQFFRPKTPPKSIAHQSPPFAKSASGSFGCSFVSRFAASLLRMSHDLILMTHGLWVMSIERVDVLWRRMKSQGQFEDSSARVILFMSPRDWHRLAHKNRVCGPQSDAYQNERAAFAIRPTTYFPLSRN